MANTRSRWTVTLAYGGDRDAEPDRRLCVMDEGDADDDQFILNAAAWLDEMFAHVHGRVITVHHEREIVVLSGEARHSVGFVCIPGECFDYHEHLTGKRETAVHD